MDYNQAVNAQIAADMVVCGIPSTEQLLARARQHGAKISYSTLRSRLVADGTNWKAHELRPFALALEWDRRGDPDRPAITKFVEAIERVQGGGQ